MGMTAGHRICDAFGKGERRGTAGDSHDVLKKTGQPQSAKG